MYRYRQLSRKKNDNHGITDGKVEQQQLIIIIFEKL